MTGIDLDAWIDQSVCSRFGGKRAVREIRRTPFAHIGSYDCERVSVALNDGACIELFLKDYSHTRQSKDQPVRRRIRELRVYRELLDGADLGTPALFGALHRDDGDECYLLLEHIDAEVVDRVEARNGFDVVRWLARMQACFLNSGQRLERADFLTHYDVEYYETKAASAARDAVHIAPYLASDVRAIVARYRNSIERFCRPPFSLVHGGYIPWHIFVDRRTEPIRVCVVDWELAGLGSTLYDLAIFADEAPAALRTALCKAYRDAAELWQVPVPGLDELMLIIEGLRLHRVVDWLSRAVEKDYSAEKVDWLVARGAALKLPDR